MLWGYLLQEVGRGGDGLFLLLGLGSDDKVRLDGEELGDIESRSLEGLDLSDDAVGNGEDLLGLGGDIGGDFLLDELDDEVLEGGLGDFLGDDLNHLLSDLLDLGSLGVGGGLELVLASLGEGDGEESEEEAVRGLGVDGGLNEGVPLSDQRAKVIFSGVHAVEVSESSSVFGLRSVIDDELDFLVGKGALAVQVSQIDLEDSSLEGIGR